MTRMMNGATIRFVIDTNVLFEGLTTKKSTSSLLVDAWYAELFQAHVTTTLAYEYVDVLSRKLSANRWNQLKPAVGQLLQLSKLVTAHYSWRPISPDPGDDHVIDCAMNAGASVVTWNRKDFRSAKEDLGLSVLTPVDAVALLVSL